MADVNFKIAARVMGGTGILLLILFLQVNLGLENLETTDVVNDILQASVNDRRMGILVISEQPEKDFYFVKRVIDGDTIELENGQVVRYIGIDAPETVHPKKSIECFGKQSYEKNKELVEGKVVVMEKDVSKTDKYGRLLRYVWMDDDIFINDYLVREGYVKVWTYPPDIKYADQFLLSQGQARENQKGLWGGCL